ncbi:MAG: PAS domain-containing protein, partial [Smithella sp.]
GVAVVDEKNFDFVKKEGDVLIAEAELTLRGKSLTIWGKAAPLRDSQGNVVGAIQSFHDITAPKQAEEALKQSLRQIDTLFGLLPGYAFFKDANLRYVRLSERACEFLGRPLKDIIGKNDFDLFPKQYAKKIREDDMKVLESGEPLLVDNEENIENEKIVILSTCKVPIKDEDGKVVGLIGLAIDITERKRAEDTLKERTQQLEDANKELESFSYSVSHDLKAPLRAIDGYARMLVKKYGHSLDEDAARMVNIIRDNTERMGLLIDDLLSFSRVLKSGIAISEINMDKLVREVWAEIQAANTERDLEFKIINALPGKGDPTLIRQVLINLLSNAVKFTKTKKPGIIEMNSYTERGKIVYCIKDNGVGFEMEYYNKLFGVFQRLHSNEEYEGTGIGLAIVHRIISRHGGRIWAEGKVDKGATLFFTLPT